MRPPLYSATQLNSPTKRLGYVALLTGLASALISLGVFLFVEFTPGYWGNIWHGLFFGWPRQFWRDWNYSDVAMYRRFCYGGLTLAVLGWLFSYGYDDTIGNVVRWIRTGST